MPGMQDVKAAIGEDDFLAGLLRFKNLVGNRVNRIDFCGHFYWRLERGLKPAATSRPQHFGMHVVAGFSPR